MKASGGNSIKWRIHRGETLSMNRLPVVLVVVALAGLLLDALSTHWNVRRYGLESEGNPALRSSMDRNGLGVALAWYGATRAVALALLLAAPWVLLRVARRWLLPEDVGRSLRRAMLAIQASSAAFCALVWWGQGLANVFWPLMRG